MTRYFGGIKLGGGGLIRAYGKATTEGLTVAQIVERKLHHVMKVAIDYTWLGKVENEIRSSSYSLEEIRYLEGVEIIVSVLKEEEEQFRSWIIEMTNGQTTITFEDAQFVEFIVN